MSTRSPLATSARRPFENCRTCINSNFSFDVKLLFLLLPFLLISCSASDVQLEADAASDSTNAKPTLAEKFGSIDSTLYDSLRVIEASSGGSLGLAAIHLEKGWATSFRGRETFPMASVGKLPMAIRFLQRVDSGAIRLDSAVTLTRADHRPGMSRFFHNVMKEGGGTTIHALLEAMISSSDNTASDYLLSLAGGPAETNRMLREIGLDGIDVSHNEGELILLWAGVNPADSAWTREQAYARMEAAGDTVWRRAEESLVDDPSDAAQPEQMAQLLALLQRRTLLGSATTDTLLAIMTRAVTGRARIPALLPPGTPVAHKTGTISSTTNDVGIITLPGGRGHLAIAIFVKGSKVGVRSRERAIASAAALIYRHVMALR